jgi:hypothetical protein
MYVHWGGGIIFLYFDYVASSVWWGVGGNGWQRYWWLWEIGN